MADLKVSSVADIKGMVDDEVVYQFNGKIKDAGKYFPAKPDDSTSVGFQIITLLDNSGGIIKGVFKGQEEITQALWGKPVTLTAYHGDRGWSGLKAKDNSYKKRESGEEVKERVLWVTKTANVTFSGAPATQIPLQPSKPAVGPPQTQETGTAEILTNIKETRKEVEMGMPMGRACCPEDFH